jgi:hypothetical protein
MTIKEAVETYQCPGCTSSCPFTKDKKADDGEGCGHHHAGTMSSFGRFFLGMPKGFNRIGPQEQLTPEIYTTFRTYDKFNIPAWKHMDEHSNTLVRGVMPRRNQTFLHIFIGDVRDKIECMEITKDDIENMD